jgi:signal transduction histidine kinase
MNSMDLHDDICQRLAGISLFCQSLIRRAPPQSPLTASLAELGEMIEETLARTRRYAHDTFPAELDTGLKEALDALCRSVTKSGCNCDLLWSAPESPLNPAQNLHICRIVQEAVQNAVKHAGAAHIQVEVRAGEGEVLVVVEDNGSGIDSADNGSDGGLGLRFMRYRARQLGADFSIKPAGEGGTRVEVRLPLKLP